MSCDPRRRFVVGTLRCHACGREHVAAWEVAGEDFEMECDWCGRMAAVPVRARAIEDWPAIAAKITFSGICELQVLEAKRGRES